MSNKHLFVPAALVGLAALMAAINTSWETESTTTRDVDKLLGMLWRTHRPKAATNATGHYNKVLSHIVYYF